MIQVDGGTQALRRTVHAVLDIEPGRKTVLSVPSAFGALILKAAAYQADGRDRNRHLADAVTLLACGLQLPESERRTAQAALQLLCQAGSPTPSR